MGKACREDSLYTGGGRCYNGTNNDAEVLQMLSFENDYAEGAHPAILKRLWETNLVQQPGYGADEYTRSAQEKIRAACGDPEAAVWFLNGGTQTNLTVIAALLRDYEGVLALETGHINTHEAGAIEYTGHKVLTLPQREGKLDAAVLGAYLADFYREETAEHMVQPGMVYLSYPTEYGTLYSRAELAAIAAVCREYGLKLYVDGARLGYGLMSDEADLTLPELAALCDAFTIGGTKVGALSGEALVFPRGGAPRHLLTLVKQHGALSAKGRLLGVQFDTLFTDDLYFSISRHAIRQAMALRELFLEKGYPLYLNSPTNQQFVVLENQKLAKLKEQVVFSVWEKADETHTVVRFATSWATPPEAVEALRALL